MKRILAVLFAFILLCSLSGTVIAGPNDTALSCSASGEQFAPGDELTVTVSLQNSPNAKSVALVFDYDVAETFTLVGGTWLLSGAFLANFDSQTTACGTAAIAYMSAANVNGNIFTLTLRVKDSAAPGGKTITVTPVIKNDATTIACAAASVNLTISGGATEQPQFSGISLTLQNNLKVNFAIRESDVAAGCEGLRAVFSLNGRTFSTGTYTIEDGRLLFGFPNVAPDEMNDPITATVYATFNGVETASEPVTYRAADYCYSLLSQYSSNTYAKLRTRVVDLLNYAAESQRYTGHHADQPANSALTETQTSWGTAGTPELNTVLNTKYAVITEPAVKWKGAALNLKDSITMQMTFTVDSTEGLTVEVRNASGNLLSTLSGFPLSSSGNGRYMACFNNLHAGQMSEAVFFTAYRNNIAVSNTLRYSIESYAYAAAQSGNSELSALVVSMMKYGRSARAYTN